MKKTFKDIMVPEMVDMENGTVKIIFSMHGVEMMYLYYHRPKMGWTHKPIMPKVWTCFDAKVTDATPYIDGLATPNDFIQWGSELIVNRSSSQRTAQ